MDFKEVTVSGIDYKVGKHTGLKSLNLAGRVYKLVVPLLTPLLSLLSNISNNVDLSDFKNVDLGKVFNNLDIETLGKFSEIIGQVDEDKLTQLIIDLVKVVKNSKGVFLTEDYINLNMGAQPLDLYILAFHVIMANNFFGKLGESGVIQKASQVYQELSSQNGSSQSLDFGDLSQIRESALVKKKLKKTGLLKK